MKYKLLVLDIDGTIITQGYGISNRLEKAVAKVQKKGILVTLTTGRMFQTALPFINDLNITLPIICYQGALIKNPKNKELIFNEPINLNLAQKILEIAKNKKIHLNIYINDALYMTRPKTAKTKKYLQIERPDKVHYINMNTYKLKQVPTKFIMIDERKRIDQIEKNIQKEFKNRLLTTRGIRDFLDILNINASKGKALKVLRKYLDIKKTRNYFYW
jgi:Cof subfamily protein (haloacid dehalogenase superfamily)